MCGIIYVKRVDGKSARKMIWKRYGIQKSRGSEGFGYVAIDDGFVVKVNHHTQEKGIMDAIQTESSNEMLFHHRYPTSTPNFKNAAHPIKVSHPSLKYDYYVVHNGIVSDTGDKVREKHLANGFTYNTECQNVWKSGVTGEIITEKTVWNDSEVLAIELAIDLDNKSEGISSLSGSIAFIALQVDKITGQTVKLYFGRNYGSPLVYLTEKGKWIVISSVGKGVECETGKLYWLEYSDMKFYIKDYKIGMYSYNYSNHYNYRHDDDREFGFDTSTTGAQKSLPAPKDYTKGDDPAEFYDQYADEYWNLLDEKIDLIEEIKKLGEQPDGGYDDEYLTLCTERLADVEQAMKIYDDKLIRDALKSEARQ